MVASAEPLHMPIKDFRLSIIKYSCTLSQGNLDFLRYNIKCSVEKNVLLRGILHVVSCFLLHLMFKTWIAFLTVWLRFLMHIQNVPRQNVPGTKPSKTKRPRDKTFQGTKRPRDKTSQRQKVPRDTTSQGTKRPKGTN